MSRRPAALVDVAAGRAVPGAAVRKRGLGPWTSEEVR